LTQDFKGISTYEWAITNKFRPAWQISIRASTKDFEEACIRKAVAKRAARNASVY
jgi:hypothetical protein